MGVNPNQAALPLERALAESLASRTDVELAVLFGSSARGTGSAQSDVDLAVDLVGADLGALSAFLTRRLRREVDLVRLSDATIPLLEALIRDGIVAFEAQPGLGARWRSRVLAELETDRPWYHRMRDAWLEHVAQRGFDHGQ